jgi:hypothetical protein
MDTSPLYVEFKSELYRLHQQQRLAQSLRAIRSPLRVYVLFLFWHQKFIYTFHTCFDVKHI